MSNRIAQTFAKLKKEKKAAFVAYVTAGDPGFEQSLEIIEGLATVGADVIELGVPFSDPMADGEVNQLAADRALKAGMNVPRVLELVVEFRKNYQTPIVLFTYLNPIFTYGFERFYKDAAQAGIDGILLLDLPPSELEQNDDITVSSEVNRISLIAPTTPEERMKLLAQSAEGFIYALSRTGVTGAQAAPSANIEETVARINQYTDVPVCVGFGISTPEVAAAVAKVSDGVVVGSAIVKQIQEHADDSQLAQKIAAFVRPMIEATKQ